MGVLNYPKWLEKMDTLIREGKSALAAEGFLQIQSLKVPREFVLKTASLSFRAAQPYIGLRLLNPIVRVSEQGIGQATPTEIAEYAYGLIYIGAIEEALELLGKIPKTEVPQAGFYEASAYISQWDYEKSIPLLQTYIADERVAPYRRLVAQLNLAAAFIYVRNVQAASLLLREIQITASKQMHGYVLAKAMQLDSENLILLKQWDLAKEALEEASKRFKTTSGFDRLFVNKLKRRIQIETEGPSKSLLRDFGKLADEASKQGNWETVRDCDRLLAIYTKNEALFQKVYFGTPYLSYRERLLKECAEFTVPSSYEWHPNGKGTRGKTLFSLDEVTFGSEKDKFDRGSVLHQLLKTLSSDFYRPMRLATIHHRLYPAEFYNPDSSPARVHRSIVRFRKWVTANKLPINIAETNGDYSLKSTGHLSIGIPLPGAPAIHLSDTLIKLMKLFPSDEFSMMEASKKLDVPVRTLSRLVSKCVEDSIIERRGAGPSSRYSFKKNLLAA